jgi:hypothetical protein
VKGRPRARSSRKLHVTAHEIGADSRTCVSVPQRGKASWVAALVSPSRETRGKRSWRFGSERDARKHVAGEPVATEVPEVGSIESARSKTPRANPNELAEADGAS